VLEIKGETVKSTLRRLDIKEGEVKVEKKMKKKKTAEKT
jgi:hypothetical protein